MKKERTITVVLGILLFLNVAAQEEIIRTTLPIEGQPVEFLAMNLPGDTTEIIEKWSEFASKSVRIVSSTKAMNARQSLSGTLSYVDSKSQGNLSYEVMIVPMPEAISGMSIALRSSSGKFISELDDRAAIELRYLLEEFSAYVKTGFVKVDVVPDDNLPAEKIKDLKWQTD